MSAGPALPPRPAPASAPPQARPEDREAAFVIGRRLSGERALPVVGRSVLLAPERLVRHVLVSGATGSGKTETALRLCQLVAERTDAPVFYLDGKGDRDGAERFLGVMADAGRPARVFPNERFDGWRGEPHEIAGRLMEIVDYASDGPAAYYRDIARLAVGLACSHADGPPRSSRELLERLDAAALRSAHGAGSAARALTEDQVRQVRLRYEAFFAQTRGMLDGSWAWEDTAAAYLLLDSLALRGEARGLARFLFEDFAHYFTQRKPRGRYCLMVVDEFSALAEGAGMAARVEQARGFNTALVLCPQVTAGMGGDEEAARLLGSVETVIAHRVNTPEDVIALAGTRRSPELSMHFEQGGATGAGSARVQHQFKVDPNQVRSLKPGQAYVIARGQAMKLQVERAPDTRRPLPPVEHDAPPEPPKPEDGVPLPY